MRRKKTLPPMKLKRTLLRAAVFALIGAVLGLGIYSINARSLMGDALPMPLGIGASVVLSGSMEPELSVDDLIIIKKTSELYERQVVVYQSGSSLVVHRIIEIDGDEIKTQGDANNTADDPITRDMIKGEVILAIPGVGRAVDVIRHPVTVILLLAAAIILMELSFKKEKQTERDELDEIRKEIEELKKE